MKQSFPGFRLLSLLHSGRRVQVFRAVDRNTDSRVILKALRSEHPPLRDIARLRHEFELLKLFDHDNIVRARGFIRDGPRVALILEDFGGDSLRIHHCVNGVELDLFIWIALQVTVSIREVHRAGVLHKDIKPENIIVDLETQRLALTDFSIASNLSQERRLALSPDFLEGSLNYLSPEQTGRMNRPVDHRSDFYSLGVTFYELLTGTTPFRADEALEMVHAHIARQPVAPRELRPEIPKVLSSIVMRLLAKNAEDRYQSSRGLLADLRRFAAAHKAGTVDDFELGEYDHSDRFSVSTALVGRESQLRSLSEAFERVCLGGNETALIGGPAGIGKSALVHELQRTLAARRGAFISGKFDALAHRSPYAALATALRELVLTLLGAPARVLKAWREAIAEAVGQNGQLLVEMIPELGVLLGPQPVVPTMPMAEAADRFQSVLRRFITALACEDHPLVIFLDDLQWADLATLKLIEDLGSDFELAYVLWIGTYRNDEVSPEHPMMRMRQALGDAQAALTTQVLEPLDAPAVAQIVRASLHAWDRDDVVPLAASVHTRSHGNPFFIRALLTTLHEANILRFDQDRGRWTWDLEAVAS
ncbi:MAG: serine/threonine protein kinase, partial [Nannocystaceae bacterium]